MNAPTSMAFLGRSDFFVLEKATGKVKRVQHGTNVTTVLDLPVNSASERGLLGVALHPRFPFNPGAYLVSLSLGSVYQIDGKKSRKHRDRDHDDDDDDSRRR